MTFLLGTLVYNNPSQYTSSTKQNHGNEETVLSRRCNLPSTSFEERLY